MNCIRSEKPAPWLALFLGLAAWLGLSAPVSGSVTIEFQLGDLPVSPGTVGILVADTNGDGFFPLEHSTTIGTGFAEGQFLGASDDVIVSVLQAKDLSFWSGGVGFADVIAAIDYDSLGLSPGTPLVFYYFPGQTALPSTLQPGEEYRSFRSTVAGASGGTIAFSTPANRGVYAMTNLATGLGGDLDLGNPGPGQELGQGIVGSGASMPDLTMNSDSGDEGNDNVTNDDTPTFSGTGPVGTLVTLNSDLAGVIGSALVDSNGNWTITAIALIDGDHQITATDGGLNSSLLQVTIDTNPPAAPADLNLDDLSDTGWSNTDNITKDNTPMIDGTNPGGGTTVTLTSDLDGNVGTTATNASWNLVTSALRDGAHVLTATASDLAGNTSPGSTSLPVLVDTVAPAAPAGLDLAEGSDSGFSSTDNLTNDVTPTIGGTAENGAAVAIHSDVDLVLGGAGSDGTFSFTPSNELSEGDHLISAEAEDAAGNKSDVSSTLAITIDTTGPVLTVNQASGQGDPVAAGPVLFTALFNEAVTGFANGDVTLGGSAGPTTQAVSETAPNDGTTYRVSVSGLGSDGTVSASVNPAVAEDLAGNANGASTSSDNTVIVVSDLAAPGNLEASDRDFSDKIRVTWNTVSTAQTYDVYRHSANDFGAAAVVGTVAGTQFDDGGAAAEPAGWFYWVVAKKTILGVNRSSPPGGPDAGQRAADQHGNTPGTATSVGFGGGETAQFGGTLEAGDGDYFRITLTVPMVLRAYTTGSLDTVGSVFDGASQLVNDPAADDDAGSGNNFETEILLRAGTYFLEVGGKGGNQSGRYELHLELSRAVLINEIDADDDGGDDREFVELFDGGAGNTALDGLTLVFYDSISGVSYHAIDLDGATTGGGGYFVAGNNGVSGGVDVVFPDGTLVNGTGAVALYEADAADFPNGTAVTTADLFDAVVYTTDGGADDPGLLPLLLPAEPQVDEDGAGNAAGHSLQRLPNFSGDPRTTSDFEAFSPTPGAENTLPGAPSIPDLTTPSDSGGSQSDEITNVNLPVFAGTARAGALVTVSAGAVDLGTAPTDTDGNWSFTTGSALADNAYAITATADKHAGGGISGVLPVTIDTVAPPVPTGLDLDPGSDFGFSAVDDITNVNILRINGEESESGVTVFLSSDKEVGDVGSVVVASPWSIVTSALSENVHQLVARAEDVAGNTSADSDALLVRIDLSAPMVTINQADGQPDQAAAGPFAFTAEFSENVYGFESGDVSVGGTAGADVAAVTGGPMTFNVAVSGAAQEGTVTATIGANVAMDTAGNPNLASTSTDNSVELDQFGDTPETAKVLVFSGNTAATPGSLYAGDIDFFEFTLENPSEITLITTGGTDTKGSLFNQKGALLNDPDTDSDAGAGSNTSTTRILPAGTYRVKLEGQTGSERGSYDLEITIDRVVNLQPDLLIGKRPTALRGGGLYNFTGAGQTQILVSKRLRKTTFHGRLENDGDAPDHITLRGARKNRFFAVRYFDGGGNATGAMFAAIRIRKLADGAGEPTRVQVTPLRKLKNRRSGRIKKKKFSAAVTAISRLDPAKGDTVKALTNTK